MPYNPALVAPMREEMVRLGARELKTVEEVDATLGDHRGTMLVFVNSVCGCAAGNARPALKLALEHSVLPQHVVTVIHLLQKGSSVSVEGKSVERTTTLKFENVGCMNDAYVSGYTS